MSEWVVNLDIFIEAKSEAEAQRVVTRVEKILVAEGLSAVTAIQVGQVEAT